MQLIYLDYAAATPVDERVLAAMTPYFSDKFYNPSSTYQPALAVNQALQAARASLAKWLGAKPNEIIFTAGGTEADNLAIHGVMRQFPKANLIVSAIEHKAVLYPAAAYDCRIARVDNQGLVDLAKLEKLIDDKTVLVSIIYANNEIGTLEPLKKIAPIIKQIRMDRLEKGNHLPLYFHSDACQAPAYLDLQAARLGVDMMSLNGGKIYGPKQSGVLFVKAGTKLQPQILGGSQEFGLRAGTENVAASIGLAKALDLVQNNRTSEVTRLQKLQTEFFNFVQTDLKKATINGSIKNRLPNNLHITLPGQDNERLLIQLEQAGILAAAGSACSAAGGQPSHVLKAIGLSDADAASSLRFSMGQSTTQQDIKHTIRALAQVIHN
ncbi:MAG: cysteine desulfurase family protein [Candidatus Saccharimonadales bacterium]